MLDFINTSSLMLSVKPTCFKLLIIDIISESMAGNMKKEILEEEVRIEEENVCIKEEVSSPFTIEDTCTVYEHGGDNTENIEINGNL